MIRLECGHAVVITNPRTVEWLSVEGDVSCYCQACDADCLVVAIGGDIPEEPSAPDGQPGFSEPRGMIDELERLARLYGSGALTDEEFRAAKAHLLGL
jgi:Short C-terminal domain